MNKFITSLPLALMSFFANTQKLPNVQTASLRAPANVKIDGKATEWNNQFQAYNKATDVFYTIANDNNKLYLVVHATDENIIKKAIMGGLTLTINAEGKPDIKNSVAVTFPVYESSRPGSYFNFNKSETTTASNVDSLIKLHNAKIIARAKFMGISNIAAIPDSILSVYNDNGINAAALLDNQLNYSCEIAIPLKYLKLSNNAKFAYNIKLNAGSIDGHKLEIVSLRQDLTRVIFTGANGGMNIVGDDPKSFTLAAPTDFWGEYTLAK